MSNSFIWMYWVYFLLAQSFIISDCISQIELGKVCIWYGFTYLFFSPALFIFNQCRKQCDDKCVCIAILYQVYQRCFLKHKGNGKQLGPIQLRWHNETIFTGIFGPQMKSRIQISEATINIIRKKIGIHISQYAIWFPIP